MIGLAVNAELIPVARDGLWGYVNADGDEIIHANTGLLC